MQVIRAEAMGMCFGVRDALALARQLPQPRRTTIYGELVHNEVVRAELEQLGFRQMLESDRARPLTTENVMITAHGISTWEREVLARSGHRVIDTTCPLVRRAHGAAVALAADGCHVVVLGRKGHVEVRGLVGDLEAFTIVESLSDVATWKHTKLGILCQTTFSEQEAALLRNAIATANRHAEIVYRDTICEPTKERQRAIVDLVAQVDAVVIVGGQNSNNTRQLVRACEAASRPTYHVQGPDDLVGLDVARHEVVGLSAGTSTPDETIDAVESALLRFASDAADSMPQRA